jgi:ribosomal protein L37AE/L43A
MDALLEALNDPTTGTQDPRTDKEYSHPYGSKGTEPENVKFGSNPGGEIHLGERLSAQQVLEYVKSIHTGYEDVETGESLGRIARYRTFELQEINPNDIEIPYLVDDETVREYARLTSEYPTVVLDKFGVVIDGAHRVCAAQDRGDQTIKAFVPVEGKTGATWGLMNDLLYPDKGETLAPARSIPLDKDKTCPTCGGGLTRLGDPNGKTEWVCTRCKYSPHKTGSQSLGDITQMGAIGPVDLIVWRVGPLNDWAGRGIYFGGDKADSDAYQGLHKNHQSTGYRVQAKNCYVAKGQGFLLKELTGKSWMDEVWRIDVKEKVNDSAKAARILEARMMKKLRAKGFDSLIYTEPMPPAKREFVVLKPSVKITPVQSAQAVTASKTKCPACGSTKYGLMPADFETAKCDKCGKTWDHGIVEGVNDPKAAGIKSDKQFREFMRDDSGATTGLRNRPDYGESTSHTSIMNNLNSKEATVKLKWRIDPAPTGPYSSFQKRNWPSAYYANGSPAAQLICPDPYHPRDAKEGKHASLKVRVADWSQKPWKWRAVKGEFKTLAEAKAAAARVIEQVPAFIPEGANIPEKLSSLKHALLKKADFHASLKRAITDFDKEQALEHYRGMESDEIGQQETFPDARHTRDWAKNRAQGVEDSKQADVEMHETSRHLPPRKDMQRHLDKDVQKEIDAGVDVPTKEGIKIGGSSPVIKTVCQNPPIPIRDFDWAAYDDNTYDGAPDAGKQCVGYGATEQEAIEDFNAQWAEMHGGEKTAGPLRKAILPVALGLGMGFAHPPASSGTFTPQQLQQNEQKALELQKQRAEKEQMDKLIAAISRAEGAKPERNNPGNIADNSGAIRTFDSYEEGEAALRNQLNRIAEGVHTHIKPDMTLEKAGLIYADGDPNWANNVSKIMHVPKHITMAELIRGPQKKRGSVAGVKTADDPAWESDLERREEYFNDQVYDAKNEAREAFMSDKYMQEEARDAGISLEQLWQETGNDYANEYWASRYGSKAV